MKKTKLLVHKQKNGINDEIVGITLHFKKRKNHRHDFERPYTIGPDTNDFNLYYTLTFIKDEE